MYTILFYNIYKFHNSYFVVLGIWVKLYSWYILYILYIIYILYILIFAYFVYFVSERSPGSSRDFGGLLESSVHGDRHDFLLRAAPRTNALLRRALCALRSGGMKDTTGMNDNECHESRNRTNQ